MCPALQRGVPIMTRSFGRLQFGGLLIIASWVRIHLGTGFPIVSSTYISYSNLHEHERFKDLLSNYHIIVHIHFRIIYFALHMAS